MKKPPHKYNPRFVEVERSEDVDIDFCIRDAKTGKLFAGDKDHTKRQLGCYTDRTLEEWTISEIYSGWCEFNACPYSGGTCAGCVFGDYDWEEEVALDALLLTLEWYLDDASKQK